MLASYGNMARKKGMVYVPVQCLHCHCSEVIKLGKQANGAQRYWCHNEQCTRRIFLLSNTRIAAAYLRSAARWST